MRRQLRYLFAAVALVTAACSDNQLSPEQTTAPAIETLRPQFSLVAPPTVCPTVAQSQTTVDTLLPQIFGPGQGRRGKAQGYSNNIVQARRNGATQTEQAYVDSLINFTLQNYYDGNLIGGQSEATQIRVLHFFYSLYCASSIDPIPDLSDIFNAENTKLIRNSTPTTTVSTDSAAVEVEQGEVPSTIFGTYVSVFRTNQPLPTSLDWYGVDGFKQGAFEFVSNPPVTFTDAVLTGVCIEFDDAIVAATDLRLAHAVEAGYTPEVPGNYVVTTSGGTIEVAAYADPSPLGLDCDPLPPPNEARGILGRVLQQFATLFVPGRLEAAVSGGSTGGTVRKFSPFAAVDIKLDASGTGPGSPQYIPVGDTETSAPVSVTVTTRNSATPVDGITVDFAPAASFAPAQATTSAAGTAGSTWTLVAGSNSGTATAPQPLTFATPVSFSVTAIQLTEPSITTTSLPGGTVGLVYPATTLQATGGDGSYTWSVTGGALPAGLTLSSGGVLSGTPTTAGTSSFTVQVSSVGGTLTSTKTFSLAVAYPGAFGSLTFAQAPSSKQCYAVNVIIQPAVAVRVTTTSGQPLAGVRVDVVAVNNNGAKVETSQPFAITGADGRAVFTTLSINKTGAYRLIAATQSPWPVASVQSGKFNISPAC
jgi:hypothetical protein